jgi:hypothetical protein
MTEDDAGTDLAAAKKITAHAFRPALDVSHCRENHCGPGNPEGCHHIVACWEDDPKAWCGRPRSEHER